MNREPYRVLLVDDEALTRKQLKAILQNAAYPFAVVCCETAKDALKEVETRLPDIIISDIQMPEMNGLQFAAALGERISSLELIFVTGYAYFEYAQEALRLGAMDFILKPIDDKNMMACLERAVKKVEEKKGSFRKGKGLFVHPGKAIGYAETQLIEKWLTHPLTPEEKQRLEALLFPEQEQLCLMIEVGNGDLRLTQLVEYLDELLWGVQKHCAVSGGFWCLPLRSDFSRVIAFLRTEQKPLTMQNTAHFLYQQEEELKQQGFFFNTAGVLWRKPLAESGPELCHALHRQLNRRFFWPQEAVVTETAYPAEEVPALEFNEELLFSLLVDLRAEEVEQALFEQIDAYARKPGASSKVLKRKLAQFIEVCSNRLCERYSITDQEEKVEEYIAQVRHSVRLEQQKVVLHHYLHDFSGLLEVYKSHRYNVVMDLCMAYIQANYNKDLSLEETARRFNFNYSYFSSYFKKVSGLKFTDYVSKIRLQKAKELLRMTDKKVYDIALEVGYTNVQYFYRVFKKEFGISPDEFRKRKL